MLPDRLGAVQARIDGMGKAHADRVERLRAAAAAPSP